MANRLQPTPETQSPGSPPSSAVAGRDDHRPFLGASDADSLQRLAQFVLLDPGAKTPAAGAAAPADESDTSEPKLAFTFREVHTASLESTPRVYVFIHGWLPGSKETTDELIAELGHASAWDERVSNTTGRTMISSYSPLMSALAQRDPTASVLWFSWVDQSSTDTDLFAARDSIRNTEINGRRLALALQAAFGDNQPELHIIGHSHGCVVATHASLALITPPKHLTLLDCPEDWFSRAGGAAGLLDNVLPRLTPGRGTAATFVDSYASMFGRGYHKEPGLADVVDVRLAPEVAKDEAASPVSQAHQFAVAWYSRTVADRACDYGFAWSPLNGFDTTELSAAYLQGFEGPMLAVKWPDTKDVHTPADATISPVPMGAQTVSRREPDLSATIAVGSQALMFEFDYDIRRAGKNTRLEVAVDRQLKFVASPQFPVPSRGRYVRLDQATSDTATVHFRLRDPGRFTAVNIDRLRILSHPESTRNYDDKRAATAIAVAGAALGSGLTLMVVAAVSLLRRRSRR